MFNSIDRQDAQRPGDHNHYPTVPFQCLNPRPAHAPLSRNEATTTAGLVGTTTQSGRCNLNEETEESIGPIINEGINRQLIFQKFTGY